MLLGNYVQRARGFTYVWVLAAIALLSLGLAQVGPLWSIQNQRVREAELIRVGTLYAHALAQYRQGSPGSLKQYPTNLDDLLIDGRYGGTQRYLRKLYPDPMVSGRPFELVKDDEGRITGVFSASVEAPLRKEPLDLGVVRLPAARRYSEWVFSPESAKSGS